MNLATKVTLLRVLLAPVFVLLFLHSKEHVGYLWAALFIAVVSEATDAIDGEIARRLNQISEIGKILDPLADSLSRQSIFLSFFALGHISIWCMLVFIFRDGIVSTIRIFAATNKVVMGARTSGKLKAVLQAIAIFGVLLTLLAEYYTLPLGLSYTLWVDLFMGLAVVVTLYSLVDYFWSGLGFMRLG